MKNIYATCIVRPFWFMINKMNRITNGEIHILYGLEDRAKHLKYFRKSFNIKEARRLLILRADDILGILLTSYIDLLLENVLVRKKIKRKWNAIPEIGWFEHDVNRSRHVELYYVFQHDGSEFLEEIGDRIIIEDNNKLFFLKFDFNTGEYNKIGDLHLGFDVEDSVYSWIKEPLSPRGYQGFLELLSNEISINAQQDIKKKFVSAFDSMLEKLTVNYINGLGLIDNDKTDFLLKAAKILPKNSESKIIFTYNTLAEFYSFLLDEFKLKGYLPIAIIFDSNDEIFPIKISSWSENWNYIKR